VITQRCKQSDEDGMQGSALVEYAQFLDDEMRKLLKA
jgi:hypothetical protein